MIQMLDRTFVDCSQTPINQPTLVSDALPDCLRRLRACGSRLSMAVNPRQNSEQATFPGAILSLQGGVELSAAFITEDKLTASTSDWAMTRRWQKAFQKRFCGAHHLDHRRVRECQSQMVVEVNCQTGTAPIVVGAEVGELLVLLGHKR
jgi:hypothetical protein